MRFRDAQGRNARVQRRLHGGAPRFPRSPARRRLMAAPLRATYRLQLTPDFAFADAEALVPYLEALGVSHLYLSPITEAVPGSTHGYDTVDLTSVRSELGGRDGFESLREAAADAGLGLVLDFVPNHAALHAANERWQHVLAHGPHAEPQSFDIDWDAGSTPEGTVRLPFLGASYGDALDDGDIALVCEEGRLFAAYYEHRFALRPDRYAGVLDEALPKETDDTRELPGAYRALDPGDAEAAEQLRPRLDALAEETDLDTHLQNLQGPALHDLLEEQHWRLAHWRTALAELNYRRFFQINDLAGLRQEDAAVFADTHRLLAELAAEEGVDGVRIDHVDGLADPQGYLDTLRDELEVEHVWVEKILAEGETLPVAWPVEGTSGYAFMNDAMGVLTDPAGERPLTDTYDTFFPGAPSFAEEVYAGKTDVMQTTLAADRRYLARGLEALADRDYHTRDLTLPILDEALTEVTAAFDRYRTYLPHGTERAEAVLDDAIAQAQKRASVPFARAPYAFLKKVALGDVSDEMQADARAWTRRFQQFTAPVAAKGVEDAAFYRYNRLAAHAEVGGEPDAFGCSKEAFHRRCRFRASHCPQTLLATATHDHKRGEETRARLLALVERPDEWHGVAGELDRIGRRHVSDEDRVPHPADAYLFYQILAALWPECENDDFVERLVAYMEKACRESKRETRWIAPDDDYEAGVEALVRGLAGDPATADALHAFSENIAADGFFNGLTQLALKGLTPGVPDVYQGRELSDDSLVDPDNRRPVDYDHRRALLDEVTDGTLDADTLRQWTQQQDERAKLYFTARLLDLRRRHPALFRKGDYRPLDVKPPEEGSGNADVWIAFARTLDDDALVAALPRFPRRRRAGHAATLALPDALAGRSFTDALCGQTVRPDDGALALDDQALPWVVLAPRS